MTRRKKPEGPKADPANAEEGGLNPSAAQPEATPAGTPQQDAPTDAEGRPLTDEDTLATEPADTDPAWADADGGTVDDAGNRKPDDAAGTPAPETAATDAVPDHMDSGETPAGSDAKSAATEAVPGVAEELADSTQDAPGAAGAADPTNDPTPEAVAEPEPTPAQEPSHPDADTRAAGELPPKATETGPDEPLPGQTSVAPTATPGAQPPILRDPPEAEEPENDGDHDGASLSTVVLWMLIAAIAAAGGALWAAPRLAPHMPEPIAEFLTPVPDAMQAEIDALRARVTQAEEQTQGAVDAIRSRVEDFSGVVEASDATASAAALDSLRERVESNAETGTAVQDTAQANAEALETLRAQTDEALAGLREQLAALAQTPTDDASALEGQVADLAASVEALSTSVAQIQQDAAVPAAPDLSEDLQAVRTRTDALASEISGVQDTVQSVASEMRSEVEGVRSEVGTLQSSLETVRAEIGAVREDATEALAILRNTLRGEIESLRSDFAMTRDDQAGTQAAMRAAALRGAAAALSGQVQGGQPYASSLAEYEALSGTKAPPALANPAAQGIATQAELMQAFPDAARAAIVADSRASKDGTGDQVLGWLRSQVASRPVTEQTGDDVPAILSRVEARVQDGDLRAALDETDALPTAATEAMQGWIADLRTRVVAEDALADYIAGTEKTE